MNSLGTELSRIASRSIGYPSEYQCEKCRRIADDKIDAFMAWAEEHAPRFTKRDTQDNFRYATLRCNCTDAVRKALRERNERYAWANLPARHDGIGPRTFANFDGRIAGVADQVRAVELFAMNEGPPILVLLGGVGSGRTHLLEAVARAMLDAGRTVRYEVAGVLLDNIRAAYDADDEAMSSYDWVGLYKTAPVLLLDDLGARREKPWGVGYMVEIIDARYMAGAQTLIATNIDNQDEMSESWDERLGSRLFDRHSGVVRTIWSGAEDYRTGQHVYT